MCIQSENIINRKTLVRDVVQKSANIDKKKKKRKE
jgi:hypothetical protein